MAALQRDQLNRLCSSSDTFEKAQSILRLANAKTRPGSGFVVKNPIAIPAVCAYLASEQLNTGEVSLQSAMSAACVSKAEFSDIFKTVRAALSSEERNATADITYETLVDAYRVHLREHGVACMEDAEAALPQVDILKERYGANVVLCAIFYWVCQLMEEPSVQERSLCQTYSIQPKAFKAVVAILDKRCDVIADQIKSHLKSPMKSPTKPRAMSNKSSKPATSPSKKRANISASFPETPTKKRRVDNASPTKPGTSISPAKRSSAADTAAFHAALKSSPIKLPIVQERESLGAGPSTPRRPRHAKVAEAAVTPVQADSQSSPSRSQGQVSPTRPAVRRRFRPVFLEQQQWCAMDPKVERMWAAAEALRDKMVELHGHPFEGFVR
ncbi:hypothetical protein EV363DRAFT_434615 [Boletus edulis]|nr:hypothetical protein EV363DRAFT_434615 [Boletus edulis]